MQLNFDFPSHFSGVYFVRGRSVHIRAGNSAVQGEPLVRVTAAAEAPGETPPTVWQYDAKRRLECRCRPLGGWGGNRRWLLLFVRVAIQLIFYWTDSTIPPYPHWYNRRSQKFYLAQVKQTKSLGCLEFGWVRLEGLCAVRKWDCEVSLIEYSEVFYILLYLKSQRI